MWAGETGARRTGDGAPGPGWLTCFLHWLLGAAMRGLRGLGPHPSHGLRCLVGRQGHRAWLESRLGKATLEVAWILRRRGRPSQETWHLSWGWRACSFSGAALAKRRGLGGGLGQQKFVLWQFWRLEGGNPGARTAARALKPTGATPPCLPCSGACRHPLACRCSAPPSASVVTGPRPPVCPSWSRQDTSPLGLEHARLQ